jgi:hypothetical protein
VAFELTNFEPRVRDHQPEWNALSVEIVVKPISPNYGKAMTTAEFENAEWLVSVAVWETGELDLDAWRKADGRLVAKHYDLDSAAQLDEVLAEILALVRDGTVPVDAVTSWLDRH